jgi:hypothetical protein
MTNDSGVRVHPFVTVQALGRLCERLGVEARVSWQNDRLHVVLVRKDNTAWVPPFLREVKVR